MSRSSPQHGSSSSPAPGAANDAAAGNCNLFVAGLPPGTTDDRLREFFQPFGAIVSAKVMIDLKTKQLRSHGFVRYAQPESAALAVASLHRRKLDDSHPSVHVAYATHSDADRGSAECEVVYIRNLPDSVTVEQLRAAFAAYGSVQDVTLPSNFGAPHTNGHQGVGFVRYSTIDEARDAVNRAHNTCPFGGDKAIQVRFKESKVTLNARRGAHAVSKSASPTYGSNPGSGTSSPAAGYRSQVASPANESLVGSPHNFSLTGVPMGHHTPQSGMLLLPLPSSSPVQSVQPVFQLAAAPAMASGPRVSPPVHTPLVPLAAPFVPQPPIMPAAPVTRTFPGTNDLYITNFGSMDWLLNEVLRPWEPIFVQPVTDGVVVRLRDETLHFAAAQSLGSVISPTGAGLLTIALLRM